ncbi:MAG: Lipopolysaccharide heptosyltransferase II [uncultured bacterium (gcode 4)]|uniref:Lipopolysaccharide heptosyltransferase II n=1 Tax=uncultured bacterium (gcode 4) TaxID=1234023 RepID=K2G293_9BACT|nr:MAG: Lipopolysaccharide heptosyltransferase II [uncultured bacterium (gcode 4)]
MLRTKFIKYKDVKIRLIFQLFEMFYYVEYALKKLFLKIDNRVISDNPTILVIRRDMLWDFIISFFALSKLKLAFPKSKIYFVGTKWVRSLFSIIRKDFFEWHFFIDPNFWAPKIIRSRAQYLQKKSEEWDDIHSIMQLKGKIDIWIDLRWDLFSLKLLNDINSKSIVSYPIWWGLFYITDKVKYSHDKNEKAHDIELVDYVIDKFSKSASDNIKVNLDSIIEDWIIEKNVKEKYICIQPGGGRWDYRRWPQKRYIELISDILIDDDDILIKLLCADNFEELICKNIFTKLVLTDRVEIIKTQSWKSTIDLINNSVLFIGHDTSTAHLCDLLDHSWIILFWPWDRRLFQPSSKKIQTIFHGYECQPCEQRKCKYPDNSCMSAIKAKEVKDAILWLY